MSNDITGTAAPQLHCLDLVRQLVEHGVDRGLPTIAWTIHEDIPHDKPPKITGNFQARRRRDGREAFTAWRQLLSELGDITDHKPLLRDDLFWRASTTIHGITVWLTIPIDD